MPPHYWSGTEAASPKFYTEAAAGPAEAIASVRRSRLDGGLGGRSMTYREVARKLIALGCGELRREGGGSHRKWHNPANGRGAVVPDHGAKDLKVGTIRAVIRQLDLDWDGFEDA